MNYWLLLADPAAYGFAKLERDRETVWDGVSGAQAQRHIRSMKKGDRALVYDTAPHKSVMGTAEIQSDPYPDPADPEGKRMVVALKAGQPLKRPVPLSELRGNPALAGMTFLKIQRIAVSPVSSMEFEEIRRMAEAEKPQSGAW